MKILFIVTVIGIHSQLFAQGFLVEYEVKCEGQITRADLKFNDSIALFQAERQDDLGDNDNPYFLKSISENVSYFNMRFMNVYFNVRDSLYNFKWELLQDTTTILEQKCVSARTEFRGRTYVAYYSTEYATNEGPWKFGGLPGLILSVKSTDDYLEYKALKIIENYAGKIEAINLKKYKFLDWGDFVAEYKSTVERFIKLARSSGNLSDGATATLKLPDAEIFYPELQTGNGIKF